jgi:two-component system sensor histidine kinase KdpD
VAMLAFNYYFLPPVGTLTIADPQNWVALFAFLVVAVLASHLSNRAKKQSEDLSARRREVERLYSFSRGLLESGNVIQLLNRIPAQIVDTFEVGAAALFLADKQKIYRSGPVMPLLDLESLKAIVAREEPVIDSANSLCFVAVRMGVRPIGSLGISGTLLSRQTLEAIGTLIAVAMERARAVEQLGQTEAAREGERLRTALLDSVTHALRTPLTSIKASVTNLLSNPALSGEQRTELLTIINEETDRLNRLVGEAGEMAQLDAGEVVLKLEPHPLTEIVSAALAQAKTALGNRRVDLRIPAELPRVRVDLARVREALVHLIENANQY